MGGWTALGKIAERHLARSDPEVGHDNLLVLQRS